MSEWNWSSERRTAIGDVANQSLEYVAERLLESRKRAFEAEREAQSMQSELDSLKAAHEWIPTSERYPDGSHARVLALVIDDTGRPRVELVVFCLLGPLWRFDQDDCAIEEELVTHWMQLPEPPK